MKKKWVWYDVSKTIKFCYIIYALKHSTWAMVLIHLLDYFDKMDDSGTTEDGPKLSAPHSKIRHTEGD